MSAACPCRESEIAFLHPVLFAKIQFLHSGRSQAPSGNEKKLTFQTILLLLLLNILSAPSVHARMVTDMAGRTINVSDTITKVYAASPPATCMLYVVAPSLLAGINYPFNETELAYLDPKIASLPVIGGWFGQGMSPNLETLLRIKPDVMIVWKRKDSAANEKIEQTVKPLNIPVYYIRADRLEDYAEAFISLGNLLGKEKKCGEFADYAKKSLAEINKIVSAIPENQKPAVYYAEGVDGLRTECHRSVHAELVPLSGGRNVYHCMSEDGFGMEKVSLEQVVLYNPDVILVQEQTFFDKVMTDPRWQNIKAVKEKKVFRIPKVPFNWFDRPPSFMRLLGIRWLTHLLHPDLYPADMVAETQKFCKLFFNTDPDENAARRILGL